MEVQQKQMLLSALQHRPKAEEAYLPLPRKDRLLLQRMASNHISKHKVKKQQSLYRYLRSSRRALSSKNSWYPETREGKKLYVVLSFYIKHTEHKRWVSDLFPLKFKTILWHCCKVIVKGCQVDKARCYASVISRQNCLNLQSSFTFKDKKISGLDHQKKKKP